MTMFNVYLAGVGGQGIGLLSEMILRSADHAGLRVKGVDTHGLAQRGGKVVSQIRMGRNVHTPLIPAGQADLVVALERHEALRAVVEFAKPGGFLIYYNTVWQPLDVRLGEATEVSAADIQAQCRRIRIGLQEVCATGLEDVRMQNMVLLAHIAREALIPGILKQHYLLSMEDLMAGAMLARNRLIFEKTIGDPIVDD
ncbi:MAG: 2-oxoacid:acceptor oxidoreductase family protein [Desulfobacteraceae bacterium]|jgi:indolepyruvate ferredoxin oxidoreductase, beta subunit